MPAVSTRSKTAQGAPAQTAAGTSELPPLDETRATEFARLPASEPPDKERLALRAYLAVRRSGGAPVRVDMHSKKELRLGRDPRECDIVLDGHQVSRVHATVSRDDRGYFTLRDNRSRNGTLVDGYRVEAMNLVDGDVFTIGEHAIEFHTEKDKAPR